MLGSTKVQSSAKSDVVRSPVTIYLRSPRSSANNKASSEGATPMSLGAASASSDPHSELQSNGSKGRLHAAAGGSSVAGSGSSTIALTGVRTAAADRARTSGCGTPGTRTDTPSAWRTTSMVRRGSGHSLAGAPSWRMASLSLLSVRTRGTHGVRRVLMKWDNNFSWFTLGAIGYTTGQERSKTRRVPG